MRIRLIGSGHNFCRHPLVPVTLLVQTSDGGNLVVNCPPQIGPKLESINMSIADIDVWLLTSDSIFSSGGIEEVCNTKLPRQTTFAGSPIVMAEIQKKFEPSRGSNKKIQWNPTTKAIVIKDEHYDEKISYPKTGYGILFENSRIALTDLHSVHKVANEAELILCNICNGSADLSLEFDFLRELPVYVQSKIWLIGYGNAYQSVEDPFPIMFMPQGSCVFDSERKDKYINKEKFIWNDSKRVAGNTLNAGRKSEDAAT